MIGRRRKRQTDRHFSPLEQVIKYWSNLDCIFIAISRQTHFEIACSAWVYSHIPASECFQASHMTALLISQPPNPKCLRKSEEVKVKQVSSLSRSVPLPYNSPESENQPRSGQRVCLGRDDDFIGSDFMGFCMFYVANTLLSFARGKKQNKALFLAGIWVTQSGKRMQPKDFTSPLSGISMASSCWRMTECMFQRLPFQGAGLSSKGSLSSVIPWGQTLSGISHHGALDSLSTGHPRAPDPELFERQPCLSSFRLRVVCLKALVSVCLQWTWRPLLTLTELQG